MRKAVTNCKSCFYARLLAVLIAVLLLFCACNSDADQDASDVATVVPVLAYHKIVASGIEFENNTLIAEDTFDSQMKYLHDNGFTTLTMDEFYDWYTGKIEVPKKSVLITFDDGYYGVYHLAYPIIKKYDMAATVFCIGHHIAEEGKTDDWSTELEPNHYIGSDKIEEVRAEYPKFEFESHTYDMHRKVDGKHPVDVFTYEQMVEDIDKNAEYDFHYLAYPWGDYNDTIKKALADKGYKMAFNYGQNYYATRQDDQYAVNRIKISGKMKLKKFKKIVNQQSEEHVNPDQN